MPIEKRIELTAVCDICKTELKKTTSSGGIIEMQVYERLQGWSVGAQTGNVRCPECRKTIQWGRPKKDGAQDLVGERFGRLTVIRRIPKPEGFKGTSSWWECRCDCGATHKATAANLRSGAIRSCGCLQREIAKRWGQANRKKTAEGGNKNG